MDPDQARQNMETVLDFTLMVFLKDFFEKVNFEKISRRQKNMKNFQHADVDICYISF